MITRLSWLDPFQVIKKNILQEDLDRDNLAPLSAQSLYRLLEEHTNHPLHAAVRLGREDVVFLDLIKYTQQVKAAVPCNLLNKLNRVISSNVLHRETQENSFQGVLCICLEIQYFPN